MQRIPHYQPHTGPESEHAAEYVFEATDGEADFPSDVEVTYRSATSATRELHRRLGLLAYPCSIKIAEVLSGGAVFSVVIWRGQVYYRVRLAPPKAGASVLVQLSTPLPSTVGDVPLFKYPEIWEFLNIFRNVSRVIPPSNQMWHGSGDAARYFFIGDAMRDVELHHERMGEWGRSIPLFDNDCGDYYLLNREGRIGFYDHGRATVGFGPEAEEVFRRLKDLGFGPIDLKRSQARPLMSEVTIEKFTGAVLKHLPK